MESKADLNEKRLYGILIAITLALGGWWLQNQWDETRRLDGKVADFARHVDTVYVDKEYLRAVTNEQTRRLERIEDKLDRIIDVTSKPKRDGL